MSSKDSPFYHWDRSSPGWLHRSDENGDQILNSDLIRIIEANPELVPDDTIRGLIVRGLKKPLPAKRGRKRKAERELKELYIVATYEHLLPRLRERMKRERGGKRKIRGTSGPAELLCQMIGKRYKMEPESVRNLISSRNNQSNS